MRVDHIMLCPLEEIWFVGNLYCRLIITMCHYHRRLRMNYTHHTEETAPTHPVLSLKNGSSNNRLFLTSPCNGITTNKITMATAKMSVKWITSLISISIKKNIKMSISPIIIQAFTRSTLKIPQDMTYNI